MLQLNAFVAMFDHKITDMLVEELGDWSHLQSVLIRGSTDSDRRPLHC